MRNQGETPPEQMRWYYETHGAHTHVRVFMNGAKNGDLCFRTEEFDEVRKKYAQIEFVPTPSGPPNN